MVRPRAPGTRSSPSIESANQERNPWTQSSPSIPRRQLPLAAATATPKSSDGIVSLDLSVPKEMGGPGKPGTATPEHLFAAGYAACFGGAIDFVAKQHKQDAANAQVTCAVSIGPRDGGGFGLAVKMRVEDKSLKQVELVNLVKEAHEKICPYSHATRNNVDVKFDVIGA